MLTINIPHLNLNQLVEDIKDRGTDSFTSRFFRYATEGGYVLSIKVDGAEIQSDDGDSIFHPTLKEYNNALYHLLSGQREVVFNRDINTGSRRLLIMAHSGAYASPQKPHSMLR